MIIGNKNRILCDFWYSNELPCITVSFEVLAKEKLGIRFANICLKFNILRMFLLMWLGKDFPLVAINWYKYGRLICVIQAILGKRNKLIIFECIDFDVWYKGPIIGKIILFVYKTIIGPCMRRSVSAIHIMTDKEKQLYADRYNVPETYFHTIQWPFTGWESQVNILKAQKVNEFPYVLSSGYVSCDWDTLFEAANLSNWPFVVVCSKKDLPHVTYLNRHGRATVRSEISRKEHQEILAYAAVYVLCINEAFRSNGQIRLIAAIATEVPVVASDVLGLDGYLVNGITGMAVEPKNAKLLATAIDNLIYNQEQRRKLITSAIEYSTKFTKRDYFYQLEKLLIHCLYIANLVDVEGLDMDGG